VRERKREGRMCACDVQSESESECRSNRSRTMGQEREREQKQFFLTCLLALFVKFGLILGNLWCHCHHTIF